MNTVWQVFSIQCLGGALALVLQNPEWGLGNGQTAVVQKVCAGLVRQQNACVARRRDGSTKQEGDSFEMGCPECDPCWIRSVRYKPRICSRVTSAAPLNASLHGGEMRTSSWWTLFGVNFSRRDAIISLMASSPSACKTVLAYPSERRNSVHALTTYKYRGPFHVTAAHVAPEEVSVSNMARRDPVSSQLNP